ncbi:MAG: rhomboid family intramembrane serine protease [Clostridium sp.]|mgnify:FL=1|nr:rhomboid family intramembrane serine protease [Clostridium sp.]SCI56342.1 Rhomboid protease gluP [uncultured Clostridium sp.]
MGSRYGKKAYVNGLLIALNVLFFLYLEITGSSENVYFMYTKGAMSAPAVLEDGEYYRLLTAMFMHFGIRHIMNNMLVLFVLGDNLERALGHVKYLIFYLLCGIGSNWVSMMAHSTDTMTVSAGASGAIFGVVGGLLYVVTANKGRLEDLSTRQLVIMIFFSLYLGYTSTGVDNTAHLSGLVIGIVLAIILYHRPTGDWWANGGNK